MNSRPPSPSSRKRGPAPSCGPDHPPNDRFPSLGSLLLLEPGYVVVEYV